MLKFLSIPFVIAGISGITMAIQGTLNSSLSQKTSLLSATFIVHLIGTLIALVALLFGRISFFKQNWLSIPWYLYLGGVLSVVIVVLVTLSIPKIGVSNATTAIIIGQVSMAVIIDHFGWFGAQKLPWNHWQLAGICLFAAGAKLLFR